MDGMTGVAFLGRSGPACPWVRDRDRGLPYPWESGAAALFPEVSIG